MSTEFQPSTPDIAVAQGQAGQPSPAGRRARQAELAGVAPRAGALLIDGILLALLVAPVRLVASFMVSTLVGVAVACLYAGTLMSRSGDRNGQTLGKQVLDLRVVTEDGGPVSFARALVRDGLFKGLLSAFTLLLDYLWALWDDDRQTLHDKAVATYVVSTAQVGQAVEVPRATPTLARSPAAGEPPPPDDRTARWLADPRGEARLRYWDGTRWTVHTAP
jgi:uncharacterized RDD family membrane protein YckC